MTDNVRVQVRVSGRPGTYFVVMRQTDGLKTEETFYGPYGQFEPAKDFAMTLHDELLKRGAAVLGTQ